MALGNYLSGAAPAPAPRFPHRPLPGPALGPDAALQGRAQLWVEAAGLRVPWPQYPPFLPAQDDWCPLVTHSLLPEA